MDQQRQELAKTIMQARDIYRFAESEGLNPGETVAAMTMAIAVMSLAFTNGDAEKAYITVEKAHALLKAAVKLMLEDDGITQAFRS